MVYKSKWYLKNGHLATIVPATLYRPEELEYDARLSFESEDDDFFEVDIIERGNDRVVVILHGLEGNSEAPYIKRLAKTYLENNVDVYALNFRGCATINNKLSYYHSGFTADLRTLLSHHLSKYTTIHLAGVSVGGNVLLKYLGEEGSQVDSRIESAFALSVPSDLKGSALQLASGFNKVYLNRFLKRLKKKVLAKKSRGFEISNLDRVLGSKDFKTFDDYFTAPHFGYKDAEAYYFKNSSKAFIKNIATPTYILLSEDDPFLSDSCYPYQEASANRYVQLEVTQYGGHVGFATSSGGYYYQDKVAQILLGL